MSEPIRVLHIFYCMGNGGIEHFVMNYYRHIDRQKVQFDFLVSVAEGGHFDEEIRRLGGKIHHAYPLKKNPVRNFFDIARIVKQNKYAIVHRHTGSAFGYYELKAAKLGGASRLILHSHNNQAGNPLLHHLCKALLKTKCEKMACSKEAADWLFGKKAQVTVLKNAIDFGKYAFDPNTRASVRNELGIAEGTFVVGHIGRFEDQKNHPFLIRIFNELLKIKPNSVLVCVGAGAGFDATVEEAASMGIAGKIRFLGSRDDAARIIQALDVFLLPSKYEGFGITLLEAQTSGLHCYTSEGVVSEEANVFGSVHYISLEQPPEVWARAVAAADARQPITGDMMEESGYGIRQNADSLCAYYMSLMQA